MDESNPIYSLKRIKFFQRDVPIVLQNENGPCPLLAIVNVLSLRNQIKLPAMADHIDQERLIALVANFLIESNAVRDDSGATHEYKANLERNLADAIALLPKLTTGIDVNVRFDGIRSFEFTDEIAIFDLMDIGLVHGWLVDPEDATTCSAVGLRSYNEAVEHIVVTLGAAEAAGMVTPLSSRKASTAAGSTPVASAHPSLGHINTAPPPSAPPAAVGSCVDENTSTAQPLTQPLTQPLSPVSVGGDAHELQPQHVQQMLDMGASDVEDALQLQAAVHLSLAHDIAPAADGVGGDAGDDAGDHAGGDAGVDAGGDAGDDAGVDDRVDGAPTSVVDDDTAAAATAAAHALTTGIMHRVITAAAPAAQAAPPAAAAAPAVEVEEGKGDVVGSMVQDVLQRVARQHSNTTATALSTPPSTTPTPSGMPAVKPTTAAVRDAKAIKDFLEASSNQLTWHGLQSLTQHLRSNELAVFFRNNHFNTLFSHKGQLFLLVTDLGFLWERGVVWEALCSVQGDTHFCTAEFVKYTGEERQGGGSRPHTPPTGQGGSNGGVGSGGAGGGGGVGAGGRTGGGGGGGGGDELDPDLLLALQLQDEEDAMHRAMIQRQQEAQQSQHTQQTQPPPPHQQRLGGVPPGAQGRPTHGSTAAAPQTQTPRGRGMVEQQQHQKSKSKDKDCVVM